MKKHRVDPSDPCSILLGRSSKLRPPSSDMKIRIKVTPNARANEVVGWQEMDLLGRVLLVRVKAPPVDGKANKALTQFLAKHFGVSKSQVSLEKGDTSRIKVVSLPDSVKL